MDFLSTLSQATDSIVLNLPLLIGILALLWIIHFFNYLSDFRLNKLGIVPRNLFGLTGILFSPFLHANFPHLLMNSFMLFILSAMILMSGRLVYFDVTAAIIVLSGLLIWLFGRRGIHIGASSLVMGYFGFLLVNSYTHPSILSFVVAGICLVYFGGMFLNLFPMEKQVSWEGHVCGFVAGILTSFYIQIN